MIFVGTNSYTGTGILSDCIVLVQHAYKEMKIAMLYLHSYQNCSLFGD